ncbi:putative ribonuclease H-like domain-containing protein [Tanacetum coccineum]
MAPNRTTTPMSDTAIKALVTRSVADALAEHEANRNSRNGDDNHESGSGRRRTVPTTRECTYSDFLKCQPLNFKGTEGVVGLTQWFENIEFVFHISNCWELKASEVTTVSFGNYALWEVIVNSDASAVASASTEGPIPPKTAEQKIARKNELKAKSTMLLAIPDEHLLKFHGIKDAKSIWEAIKTRFGGNKESKKMQKTILKQQYKNFTASRSEGLDKIYDSTNEAVNTALDVSTTSTQGQASSLTYADDVMFSFFVNQSKSPLLDNKDIEQIDSDDLEEMDLKWQVAMLTLRIKRFIKKTRRNLNLNGKEAVGLDMIKVECYNYHRKGHFARDCRAPRNTGNRNGDVSRRIVLVYTPANALVVQDGIGYQLGLESLEARIVVHEKNEASYEESIAFLKYDVQAKDISIKNIKNQLEEALKEKDDLKLKLENFKESSKNLTKLINSQISVKDKTGLGFDSHVNESEILDNVVDSHESALSFAALDDSVHKSKVSEIITNWESDSEVENVFEPKEVKKIVKSSFKTIEFVNARNLTIKKPRKFSQNPRDNKRNGNSFEFTKKAYFDFSPTTVLTKSGIVPMSASRQSSSRAATPTSAARPINTAAPKPFFNAAKGNPQYALQDQGIFDSGCSRHMTGNKLYLSDYQDIDGGFVAFGGSSKGGKITRKGKIRTEKLNFEDVYFVKELKFNLFSVSQMCDKKNSVLFAETECLVLSNDFKLLDESQVLLKILRQNNMYSFDLKNIVPSGDLTCLFTNTTIDESNLWHRRLGHINLKTMNKLMRGNHVRGLPSKIFENDHTCVACQKGKQHKASCKTKTVSYICKPLQLLHMDLFRPVSVRSINRKSYCLVVTDDFSRFSWVFFLATKYETPRIFKNFITGKENQSDHKVKIIRSDNGTEFKNRIMNEFYEMKGIRREFSVTRTPQQNGVAEKKNKTLIEASRTMLTDFKLPTTFWAEAVNTACYVQNRMLVIKPHNKTPYKLFLGRKPALSFMRPFGCLVTILNTLDHLGKFDGKSDDGFFIGYSINSKAFRVFNTRTRFVDKNLHINFLENKPNVTGTRPNWMFDIDTLTMSMNYQPVFAGNQTNGNAGTKENINAGQAKMNTVPSLQYVLLPFLTFDSQSPKNSKDEVADDAGKKNGVEDPTKEDDINGSGEATNTNNTNRLNTVSSPVNADANSTYRMLTPVSAAKSSYENLDGSTPVNAATPSIVDYPTDPLMSDLEDTTNLQDIGIFGNAYDDEDVGVEADLNNLETIMNMSEEHAMISYINKQRRTNHKDYQNSLFACFLSQMEPKKVIQALEDSSWVEEMQEELMQIEAIRLFLAYASFMGFIVYQMDVKSAFLYGTIEEEVYVDDIIFGSTKKSLCTEFESLMHKRFQMSSIGELTFFLGLQVKQKDDGIFISQDKYVANILKKFDFSLVKTARTSLETNKALIKDEEAEDVDVHLYRSMIGSLMYLTASRPDIMFAVCACARFQVTPKTSHLHAVKRIFRYLKGQPKLGLWYPRDSPFDLEAFSDSDYAGASLDRKSTTGGCQFLGKRLISWQCKKQTIVANSTTEAEYVAAANCCGQVLWIQNQMLDYGFNFMNTKIYIDNESTICIVKNLVFHSKTKHIEIRHHFIRDCYEKKLIQVIKIHTNHNVADLLTKAFDFWNTATSKTVNSVKQIHAIVDGKAVVISESSVRSDLFFNDEDGIDCVTNDEIFDNLALMRYEQLSTKLSFKKGYSRSLLEESPFECYMAWITSQWKWLCADVDETLDDFGMPGPSRILWEEEAQLFVGMDRSEDGIVQAGSGVDGLSSVRGFHQLCLSLGSSPLSTPEHYSADAAVFEELRGGSACDDLPEDVMRLEMEEVLVRSASPGGEALESLALPFFFSFSPEPFIIKLSSFITMDFEPCPVSNRDSQSLIISTRCDGGGCLGLHLGYRVYTAWPFIFRVPGPVLHQTPYSLPDNPCSAYREEVSGLLISMWYGISPPLCHSRLGLVAVNPFIYRNFINSTVSNLNTFSSSVISLPYATMDRVDPQILQVTGCASSLIGLVLG